MQVKPKHHSATRSSQRSTITRGVEARGSGVPYVCRRCRDGRRHYYNDGRTQVNNEPCASEPTVTPWERFASRWSLSRGPLGNGNYCTLRRRPPSKGRRCSAAQRRRVEKQYDQHGRAKRSTTRRVCRSAVRCGGVASEMIRAHPRQRRCAQRRCCGAGVTPPGIWSVSWRAGMAASRMRITFHERPSLVL